MIERKKQYLADKENNFLSSLDGGSLYAKEDYYQAIIKWIYKNFARETSNFKSESSIILSKNICSFLRIFDNLMLFRSEIRREFYNLYYKSQKQSRDDNKNIFTAIKTSTTFCLLKYFVQSAIHLQNFVKNCTFSSDLLYFLEKYFSVSLFLKNIAEENHIGFKLKVGNMEFDFDDKLKENRRALDLLYEGLMFYGTEPSSPDEINEISVCDRIDLLWYNIVT